MDIAVEGMQREFADEGEEEPELYPEAEPRVADADESWMREMGVKIQELRPAG